MNRPVHQVHCQVLGAEKLSSDTGGSDAFCAAIDQALAAVSPKPASVEVRVLSPYLAEATVTLGNGRSLPAVKVGRSDRPLGKRSVQMLADGVAAQVAGRQHQ